MSAVDDEVIARVVAAGVACQVDGAAAKSGEDGRIPGFSK